ncbi:MAG TPA: adenylate/guanylate cyclase domain-containing protein [Solirubrobacterales bacterium]
MTATTSDDGERKQVTVLFADVMGSMDLAEQQDPEQWRKIMQRFFSILAEAVERFDGTVDKFTGDGIMAVFGAPVAYEDHPRRACYAALQMLEDVSGYAAELRREAGLNFSIRIGINSGEVVAGAIGEAGEGEYTAIGHTVGLAQRMEALAEPGKAYLTEHTASAATGYLALEDLGEFEIKGASRPVQVFELAGVGAARSRLDLSRERGFSRFVGRAAEMDVLEEALERAKQGEGAVVGIVAEPGIGKSRLCHEFAERCREEGIDVFEAQAQSHGQSIPFMPVLQMLRAYFGIADREPERIAREKIAGRALLIDPGFADELPLVFDFLGVPDPGRPAPQMSPEARQRALGGVVCRLINAADRHHTVVTVIEDLHWMDEGSESLLRELADSIAGTNTLAVVNFRPEYTPGWSASPTYRRVSLQPLGPSDTGELLRDLAGEDPSLDGLEELIHERTAGNPFFIEEIVRELAETGRLEGERGAYRLARPVEDSGVPAGVQAILAARIDRLDPDAKLLLQVASVVGKEFGVGALHLTAGLPTDGTEPALCALTEGGFLYEAEIYPERVFAFRHPLTREVAYGSQLAERREATHAAAAQALIELEADRLDELAGLVADHMEAGGETLEAARWSARAAHWAGHTRPQDSMRLWQQVMTLVEELEEDEETAALAVVSRMSQLDYAWRLGMDREATQTLEAEATEIAERIGDLRSLALLKLLTSARPGIADHTTEWVAAVKEAIGLADETGDPGLRLAIRGAGAYAYMCAGNLEQVERVADEMIELAGGDPTLGAGIVIGCPLAWGLAAKSSALRERDQPDAAEKFLDEALGLAAGQDDPETEGWIRGSKSAVLADRGEFEAALAMARRSYELADKLGDVFSRTMALTSLAYVQIESGEYEEALASIEPADRLYREAMGVGGETEGWRATLRSRALLGAGRGAEAAELAAWAAETGRRRGMNWQLPPALCALAHARAATGVAGVEEALDEATEVARRLGQQMALRKIGAARDSLTTAHH